MSLALDDAVLVAALDLCEMHEELAHREVLRLLRRLVVEIGGLQLHHLGFLAHALIAEIIEHPDAAAFEEAARHPAIFVARWIKIG